jgi:ribosomal protein S18 acetylase RimI-like enzyme
MKLVSPLPQGLITKAAELYAEAFTNKAFMIVGPKNLFEALLRTSLDPHYALGVLDEKDNLLGVAGFKVNGNSFVNIDKFFFEGHFHKVSAHFRFYITVALFNRFEKTGQLLMDGIAVDSKARGGGVGTVLLNGVIDKARELQMKQVRLDVIDENPNAKRLYERLGFKTIRHIRLPFLKKYFGLSGVSTMIRDLQ